METPKIDAPNQTKSSSTVKQVDTQEISTTKPQSGVTAHLRSQKTKNKFKISEISELKRNPGPAANTFGIDQRNNYYCHLIKTRPHVFIVSNHLADPSRDPSLPVSLMDALDGRVFRMRQHAQAHCDWQAHINKAFYTVEKIVLRQRLTCADQDPTKT